mgnify:FL=1|jgi:glutaredoxin
MRVVKPYVVYGKQDCIFCDKARRLLKSEGVEFTYLQLDSDFTMDELWEKVKFTTYPQIFLYDYPIGGYSDLQKSFDKQKGLL